MKPSPAAARRRTRRVLLEALETRQLLSFSNVSPIPDVAISAGAAGPTSIDLTGRYVDGGTVVRLHLDSTDPSATGDLYFELTDAATPLTVANFLNYVNSHRYDNTVIHRLIPGFVMQGGGYTGPDYNNLSHITQDPPVVNEFSASRSNVRGTIAMAKVDGDPDSATSEWFINLADNSGVGTGPGGSNNPNGLDFQNEGFTTFGTVAAGMSLVDYIAANALIGPGDFPVVNYTSGTPDTSNFLNLQTAAVVSGYTYSVTSSNPSFVTASVAGSSLSLSYGSPFGSSLITVTATDPSGRTVTDSFTVGEAASLSVQQVDTDGNVSALPASVDFGFVDQNSPTPNKRTLRVTNTGAGTLTFSSPTEPAGFFIYDVLQENGTSAPGAITYTGSGRTVHIPSIAPGHYLDIVIAQRSDTGGDKSGTLFLNTNDSSVPAFGVPLTGFTHYKKLDVSYGGTGLVADPTTHVTSSVNLGSGVEGTSFLVTFHVTNTGDTLDLSLGTPTLPAGFSVVTPLPTSLAAGASADLVLAVDTSSPGTRSGTIIFNSGDPLYALSSPGFRVPVTAVVNFRRLAVTDLSGAAVASWTSVNFGTVLQGDTARVTYHLANTGDLPMTLSNPTLPAGYSLVGAFPTTIAAGGSADIVLALDTMGRGTYSGAFSFNTNDADNPSFAVYLSGRVIAKGIVVSLDGNTIPYGQASTVDFGNVRQGTGGKQVTFTVSNSGLLPLTFQTASIPAGYSIVQALPDSLAPGASAQFTVALDTSNTGYFAGTLHIVSSDPDRPSFDVPLSAGVTMPVKLGAGGATSVTFTDADGTMSTVTLGGPGSAVLDFLGDNLVTTGTNKKGVTVAGSSVTLSGVTLAGTSVRGTTLEIVSKGGKVKTVDIGDVSGSALLSLEAPAGRLVGDVAIKVGTLSVAAAQGATLALGAGAAVEIPVVRDTTLTTGRMKSLTVNKWIGGSITAKTIDSLRVNGNINTSLTVKKALGNATVAGNLAGGTWTLGSVNKLEVGRKVTGAWVGVVKGGAANVVVGRNFGGAITAKVLGLTVNGSVAGATVSAKSLTQLSVTGSLANSSVTARAVSKVVVGRIKTHNGGTAFGLTARSIGSLVAGLDTGKTVRLTGVSNAGVLNSQLKAQGLGAMNDLKIRIG